MSRATAIPIEDVVRKANALIGQELLDLAENCYLDAIEENPDRLGLWLHLGELRLDRRDYKGAEQAFLAVTQGNPKMDGGHAGLSLALQGQHRHEEAAAAMREALRIKQTPARWASLGTQTAALGVEKEALQAFRTALEGEPKSIEALVGLAMMLRGKNQDEVESLLKRASEVEPDNADVARELGLAMFVAHNYGDALLHLQRAVHHNDKDAWAHYYLSLTLRETGEQHAADKHLKAARQLAPKQPLFKKQK